MTVALFVRSALYYIGGLGSLEAILKALEAHPHVQICPATRKAVQQVLRTDPLIRRAGKGIWLLTESR